MQFYEDLVERAYRYPLTMHEEWPDVKNHMVFHRQFFSLIREHAEWVASDTFIMQLFQKHCHSGVQHDW